mgnify:CR=1 FL=1
MLVSRALVPKIATKYCKCVALFKEVMGVAELSSTGVSNGVETYIDWAYANGKGRAWAQTHLAAVATSPSSKGGRIQQTLSIAA